jgi:hypothetical protein
VVVLVAAALLGGSVMFAVLWPCGDLTACIGAPFGGSALALLAGLLLAFIRTRGEQKQERRMQAPHETPKTAASV